MNKNKKNATSVASDKHKGTKKPITEKITETKKISNVNKNSSTPVSQQVKAKDKKPGNEVKAPVKTPDPKVTPKAGTKTLVQKNQKPTLKTEDSLKDKAQTAHLRGKTEIKKTAMQTQKGSKQTSASIVPVLAEKQDSKAKKAPDKTSTAPSIQAEKKDSVIKGSVTAKPGSTKTVSVKAVAVPPKSGVVVDVKKTKTASSEAKVPDAKTSKVPPPKSDKPTPAAGSKAHTPALTEAHSAKPSTGKVSKPTAGAQVLSTPKAKTAPLTVSPTKVAIKEAPKDLQPPTKKKSEKTESLAPSQNKKVESKAITAPEIKSQTKNPTKTEAPAKTEASSNEGKPASKSSAKGPKAGVQPSQPVKTVEKKPVVVKESAKENNQAETLPTLPAATEKVKAVSSSKKTELNSQAKQPKAPVEAEQKTQPSKSKKPSTSSASAIPQADIPTQGVESSAPKSSGQQITGPTSSPSGAASKKSQPAKESKAVKAKPSATEETTPQTSEEDKAQAKLEPFRELSPQELRKLFFKEVPVGAERIIKHGDKNALVAALGSEKKNRENALVKEESPEELVERIAKELDEQRVFKRGVLGPPRCTKCGINPAVEEFTIDRELAYCPDCAILLHLGETKEARKLDYPSLLQKDEDGDDDEDLE